MKSRVKYGVVGLLIGLLTACGLAVEQNASTSSDQKVNVAGAMKNVMWKGELEPTISLDSLSEAGWYGIGPLAGLRGEVMLWDGVPYVSEVVHDTSMRVYEGGKAGAPFLVYAHVPSWYEVDIPDSITDLNALEHLLDQLAHDREAPFVFKLAVRLDSGQIHIQNLPVGAVVRSPKQAHQGQVNYAFEDVSMDLLGFFSRNHQGVFTHHDTYMHIHAISTDRMKMGHLDAASFKPGRTQLFVSFEVL